MTNAELATMIEAFGTFIAAIGSICAAICIPIIVLVFVFIFRRPVRQILENIGAGKLIGKWGNLEIRHNEILPQAITESKETKIHWEKTGHLWWLGDDIRTAIGTVLYGHKPQIVDRLERVHHHAKALNLGEQIVSRFRILMQNAQNLDESYWTEGQRQSVAHELQILFNTIAQIAQANDPDFKPDPE